MRPDRGRRSPAAKIAVGLLLAAYAAAAVGSGLDRMAARNPALGERVPDPFAALSHAPRAMLALSEGRFGKAEGHARRAVATAPLEPASTGLLGAALLAQEKLAPADRAFRVAGQLGWREPATQLYWMRIATQTGDWDIAAQRADAILRIDPSQTRSPQVVAPFEADPAGRRALVARMRQGPGWLDAFFRPDPSRSPESLAARAEMLTMLAQTGTVDCAIAAPFADRLVRAGSVARAHAIWSGACKDGSADLLRDADFARAASPPDVPFDWQLVPSGALTVARDGDGLSVTSRAAFPRTLARQLLVLEPGAYRLDWREQPSAARSRIVPIVGCQPDRGARPEPRPFGEGRMIADFTVDGSCEGQWLTLMVTAGAGAVRLGDFKLVRR